MHRLPRVLFLLLGLQYCVHSEVSQPFNVNVKCSKSVMQVTVNVNVNEPRDELVIYLDKLKDYPGCQPNKTESKMVFLLPIDDTFYSCGTTKLQNKITDTKVFYNRLIVENATNKTKEVVLVNCVMSNEFSLRSKRQVFNEWPLPENFTESIDELIDFSGNVTERAPIPYLNAAVRQNGRFVDTALNVHPGTPLEMIIYLDEQSAKVYGLFATFLKVTDNTSNKQEEIIVLNGCSIDPYIFSNFETEDGGNSLTAKFRAFKFPESNFVLFVGTVNVCLNECKGVPCGNSQLGFGRKKRSIPYEVPADPNKVFEVEMTAFLKVDSPANDFLSSMKATITSKFEEEEESQNGDSASKVTSNVNQLTSDRVSLPLFTSDAKAIHSPNFFVFVVHFVFAISSLVHIS